VTTEAKQEPSTLNVPNVLTAFRLALVPVMAWVFLADPASPVHRWAAAAVFVVASITDLVDGKVARAYGLVTSFGKLWDPIADKALTGMAFVMLSVVGDLPWWVTIVVLVREWGITLLRFVILKYGVMAANRGGKAKTFLQTLALTAYLIPLPEVLHMGAVVLMGAAVILTVVTGVDYLWEAWKMRRRWLAEQAGSVQPIQPDGAPVAPPVDSAS